MDRTQIEREDFPSARRGWDPAAVRAHLNRVAEDVTALAAAASAPVATTASTAAEKVQSIVGAAEQTANEILADARAQAGELVAATEAEVGDLRSRAAEEARADIDRVRVVATGLLERAEDVLTRLDELAEGIPGQLSEWEEEEEVEEDVEVAEPEPGIEEDLEVEEEGVAQPEFVPEAAPEPFAVETGSAPQPVPAEAAEGEVDKSAKARLIAFNLALGETPREEIAARLAELGVEDTDAIIEDAYTRAGA